MPHRPSFRLAPSFTALLLVMATDSLGAQGRRSGTLTGRVLDEQGVPVPNVEIAIAKLSRATRTDTAGKYTLALVPPGSYDVAFRRVSYAPMMFTIDISQGDTTEAEVKMNAVPQAMTTVHVEESRENVRDLGGFEDRRKLGVGRYVTREEIERRNPQVLSDMLRTMPGVMVKPAGMGRSVLRFSRAEGRGRSGDCPPTYFIDGTMAVGYNLDDMSVSDVEAIEIYSGVSTLPAQFAKARSTIMCGTVVIWTRIPGNKKKP
jgi:hypothetical protein